MVNKVLYLSIVDVIKKRIKNGEYKPGDMLDSEASMMKEFSVSRMTIRKSLSLLSNEGYVFSIPGKGNYVCTPEKDIFQFHFGKYEDFLTSTDDVKLISINMIKPDAFIKEKFSVKDNSLVIQAVRAFISENVKVAYGTIYFAYIPNRPIVEDLLRFANHIESIKQSLAFALEKKIKITGTTADADIVSKLECEKGKTLFCIEEEMINTDLKSIFSYMKLYVLPEYFTLSAYTAKDENDIKKIF